MNDDITPDFKVPTAEHEVALPSGFQDTTSQVVGGFSAGQGVLQSGQTTIDGANQQIRMGSATAILTGIGIFMGNDGAGTIGYDFRVGDPAGNYIAWDASLATLTVKGSISVSQLDIPDITTASSFHVDASGNTWWGSNVATGIAGAVASITAAGNAKFKNVQIGGTTQLYSVGDAGMGSFGDGSDSAATFSDQGTAPTGTTKTDNTAGATIFRLDRDVYYTTMTIDTTVTLNPNGYRIFCSTSATINGTINRNGSNGGTGNNGVQGGGSSAAGGSAASLSDGYLKGAASSGAGGNGGGSGGAGNSADGTAGTSTSNCLVNSTPGAGGNGGANSSGTVTRSGGAAGTTTVANVKLIANWHLNTLLDISSTGSTVKFNSSATAGGGGGGDASGTGDSAGGSGGGGGGNGGIIALYAKSLTLSATGVMKANGGNGGNGGNASNRSAGGFSGGGGGGGGGNGGVIVLVYNSLSNAGTLTCSAGTGGTKGLKTPGASAPTADGVNGTDGAGGVVYQFQLSL